MKKFLFLLTGLMFMLASCGGGEDENTDPTPTPKPNEPAASITMSTNIPSGGLAFDVNGGEKSVSFTTNKDWTVTVAATTGGATWCTASPASGSQGDATVKFSVKENTDYDDRSVSVTIKAGTATKTFTINQKGADALLVTTKKYEVAQEGGEIEVEVQANIDYEMEISETAKSWITEASTRALTTHKHTFTIAANEELEKREGEIIFKSGDKVETVTVYQAGGPVLLLSKNEFNVSDAGETITIEVKSNIDFGVQMPDVDWIVDEASTRGMSSHTLKYDILPNETYDARETEILFYDKNSDLKETVKIVQVQKDAIIISQKNYEVKAEGETIEVKLSANVEFDVTMPDVDWITQVTTRGLTEHTLYYKVAENTGEDSRSAEIVFTNKESQLSEKIVVTQQQKSVLSLDKNEYSASAAGETISIQVKSNVAYEIQMPDVDWITKETSTRAATTETVKFVIAQNETYDGREAEILFKDKNSNLSATLKITQAQKNAIILSQKEINVKAEGETIEVKVSANVEFDVQIPDVDWISQVTTRGLTEHTLYFDVAKNENDEARRAEFVFTNKDSNLSETLIVVQQNAVVSVTLTTAGTLRGLLGDDYLSITSLKVDGPINGDDVYCLQKMVNARNFSNFTEGKLRTLDLSEATIVEGGGSYRTSNDVIGDYMFYKCSLSSLVLPNSVKVIGKDAFSQSDIESIYIPKSLTSMGSQAFIQTFSLSAVYISDLSAWCKIDFEYASNPLQMGAKLYLNNKEVTDLVIPDDITEIKKYAFQGCSSLTSIIIPESVSSIGLEAFKNCSALTSVTIGNGVTSIESLAFRNCSALTSVTIGNGVTSIGNSAFQGCKSLTSISIPESVTSIGNTAFSGCTSLASITIPESVTSIGSSAFQDCSVLTSVTIGNSVSSIGDSAFQGCKSLTSITIPESVISIGHSIFENCKSLASATINSKSVSSHMFLGCESLTNLTLGRNVEEIQYNAFNETYGSNYLPPQIPIEKLVCYATTPPELIEDLVGYLDYYEGPYFYFNAFSRISRGGWRDVVESLVKDSAKLYIPDACANAYMSEIWDRYFDHIIEM